MTSVYFTDLNSCEICEHGPQHGVAIYRTTNKSPDGRALWRCSQHNEKPVHSVPPIQPAGLLKP